MSKIAPHNSFVEFIEQNGIRIAVKTFRRGGKYTAAQEARAYSNLAKILPGIDGVRLANIRRLDAENNALHIEYIASESLFERIINGDEACLEVLKKPLINLFLIAKQNQVHFDSDPSNIMFDNEGIVFIDPVCTELSIEDYSFIVFMWGLIKIALRNRRIWRIRKIIAYWKDYYREYCHVSGTNSSVLNHQMENYIDLVINWNKERNANEGYFVYVFRYIVVIPIYSIVRQIFRWNHFS